MAVLLGLLGPEDEGHLFLQNVRKKTCPTSQHHIPQEVNHFFPPWYCGPTCVMASSFLRFLDHTHWRITVSRTPLDKWSAHHRDLYL